MTLRGSVKGAGYTRVSAALLARVNLPSGRRRERISPPLPPSCPRLWQRAERKAGVGSELTASHRVPGSIPEQAISCAGREGNGESMATMQEQAQRERQPDSDDRAGAKGVTAGETAPLSTRTAPRLCQAAKSERPPLAWVVINPSPFFRATGV